MQKITFEEIINRIREVHKKFPRKYDRKTEVINLLEEVGELANAVLVDSGDKPEKRRRAQLKDSFADILFALTATADAFDVDLEEELLKTLNEIEDRQNKKEYEDD